MPATPTRVHASEEEMEKKGSVLKTRGFNIGFTLGEFHLYFGWRADTQKVKGCVMLFATAVCVIIKRHRSRFARRGAMAVGADRVNSRGGHERTEEHHVGFPRAFLDSLVRKPPPAYMPAEGLPHDEVMRWLEGFQVSVDDPPGAHRANRILQVGGESGTVSQ